MDFHRGQKRAALLSESGLPWASAHAATCLSLICVNAGGVTVLAPHHLNRRTPTLSLVHRRPFARTPERDEANTQTCGIPKRMGAGWKRGRMGGCSLDPLPSNSYHTEQIKESRCYQPTLFLTLPITEDSFSASVLHQQGFVWSGERPTSWGESQLQVRGSRRERGRQPKDEKLAFQIDS